MPLAAWGRSQSETLHACIWNRILSRVRGYNEWRAKLGCLALVAMGIWVAVAAIVNVLR